MELGCVREENLRAFLRGELPNRAADQIVEHLQSCSGCEARARQLDTEEDPFLRNFRRVLKPNAGAPDVPGALARVDRSTGATTRPAPNSGTAHDSDRAPAGYEFLSVLGRGGMGVVYKARQLKLNRVVALKMNLHGANADARGLIRFLDEAEAVAAVKHPHVVEVFEAGECDRHPFLVMEYLPGGTLAARLRETGRLAPRAAGALVEKLAAAVQAAHDLGIVHRDLKPGNVLFDATGEPRVTDFGLAKRGIGSAVTHTNAVLGTPAYMAPEQARGNASTAGPGADIYSLGVILYECLTGSRPFDADDPVELLRKVAEDAPEPPRKRAPGVPRDLELICLTCLAKAPADRYPTARTLAEDLRRYALGRPVVARPIGPAARAVKWARRNPALAFLSGLTAALSVVVLVVCLAAAIRLGDRANEARQAERDATEKLFQSSLEQAKVNRLAGQTGQRAESLRAIRQAVASGRALGYGPDRMLAVRNAAVAALTLTDLEIVHEWEGCPPGSNGIGFDSRYVRYARSNRDGTVSLRRVADDGELARFQATTPDDMDSRVYLRFGGDDRFLVAWFLSRPGTPLLVWELGPTGPIQKPPIKGARGYCDITPDGRELIVGLLDGGMGVYDLSSGQFARCLPGATNPYQFAVHPTRGQVAVSTNAPPGVELRDLATGALIRRIHVPSLVNDRVNGVCWDPTGTTLAVAGHDHRITLWDAATGTLRKAFHGHQWEVSQVSFDRTGTLLVSSGFDATTRIWDVRSGHQLVQHPAYRWIGFDREGRIAAALVEGTQVRLGAVTPGAICRTIPTAPGWRGFPDFSPDGRLFVSPGDHSLCICNVRDGRVVSRLPVRDQVPSALFEPDGRGILALENGRMVRWPLAPSGEPLGPIEVVRGTAATRGSDHMRWWGRAGRGLLYSENRSTLRLLSLDPPGPAVALCHDLEGATYLSSSPDGRWVAAGVWDASGGARVYDTTTGKQVLEKRVGDASVAFSPDGRWLALSTGRTAPEGARCTVFRVGEPWEQVASIPLQRTTSPGHTIFSPDGQFLAVQTTLSEVTLFDTREFRELVTLRAGEPTVLGLLGFSPDGRYLASSLVFEAVQLWDLAELRSRLLELELDWQE